MSSFIHKWKKSDFHKDTTEGCALQGPSRGASAVIKDYAVVPKETEPVACAEEPRVCDEVHPTAGGHVLSSILTCRSIPDLTGVGSTSCLYLSVCLSSIYHPSLCLYMRANYGICVELRAQMYGIGSSLYLQVYPGDQTQVIRFVLVLGSKHNSCMLWKLMVSARLFSRSTETHAPGHECIMQRSLKDTG